MTDATCASMAHLIQADVDGELPPAEAAQVEAHVEACPACATIQAQLLSLSAGLRGAGLYYPAPDALRASVRARIATLAAAPPAAARRRPGWWSRLPRPWSGAGAPFGAGFALAACLGFLLLVPATRPGLQDAVVAGHIRALQPGHLMDVASTDQHTVKPWFDGRLDYAPPVKDLKAHGFPLVGGRLDYLAGRPVAALVYQRRQHLIDLYVWPDGRDIDHAPSDGERSGYNVRHWNQDGMAFWATSDVSAGELAEFTRLWRETP